MKKIGVILGGVLFIIIGIVLLVQGNAQLKRCTEETVGTVIEIREETSTDSDGYLSYTYYPVFEYKAGERAITKQSNNGSNASKYKVNDKVDILYNPNNVEEFIIKGDKSSKIMGIIFIVLGGIVFVCGIIRRF